MKKQVQIYTKYILKLSQISSHALHHSPLKSRNQTDIHNSQRQTNSPIANTEASEQADVKIKLEVLTERAQIRSAKR
jgi:hypothetical protein